MAKGMEYKYPEEMQAELVVDIVISLDRILNEKGISRSEFAKKIGRSESYVTRLMRGNPNITVREIANIACALEREATNTSQEEIHNPMKAYVNTSVNMAITISDTLKNRGITETEFAEKIGHSKSYAIRLLRGESNFNMATLANIAYALDMYPTVNLSRDKTPEGKLVSLSESASRYS
ncbi:helix-turn-helix transcriptional regulator [Candidatus Pacearchaeota archaeon]|nr:helix-turn-helix transcriptional regulator [Candidatus Pacearchaeota archaeon]